MAFLRDNQRQISNTVKKVAYSSFILIMVMIAGCTPRYTIHSNPDGAAVYINEKKVGDTPMEISYGDVPKLPSLHLRLEKDGHGSIDIVVPGPSTGELSKEIQVNIPKQDDISDKINSLMAFVGYIRELTNQERYPEAVKVIDDYIKDNPKVVYPNLLKASVLFLSKNYQASLALYQKVLEKDPQNSEALKMVQFVKGKTKGVP